MDRSFVLNRRRAEVVFFTSLALGTRNLAVGENCTRVVWSVKELEDNSDGTSGPYGDQTARGLTAMVEEVRSQNWRSLQNMNTCQLVRPRTGQEDACSV